MVELVRFRLRRGGTVAEWLQANEKVNAWLAAQPGFRLRCLSETADGVWIDLLHWETPAAAAAAGERFGEEMGAACEPMIDLASIACERSQSHIVLHV